MTKYIPRYYWPNGYKLEQFRGYWLFAPFLAGYGNKKIVDYFCRGKTPEEAEKLAYERQNKTGTQGSIVSRHDSPKNAPNR